MNKLILPALALATLMGALAAPAQAQNLAIVNGKPIPLARVDALAQQFARSGRQITPDMMEELKKAVIDRELLVQEAQKQGLDASAEFKAQMEFTRDSLLIRDLVANFQKTNAITDAEVQAEYDKFVAANAGKEYRARHILVEKEAEAKAIIAQLKKGAKFDAIAKKQSKDPGSGANGGDLDWAAAGNYVKEFSDAMVALAKGKYTETPVKTQFGYHVIRLDDVREAQLPKIDEIKPQITQQLGQQKLIKFQDDLRSKAKIE
ncbi:peptidylprolyl isomerase [Rhodoferax sp. BAB1]|uniref:foldase protein PrsA n=1 Tax=Rhodoferax sp. BAB1 TaxID=2741720 RepID=UPI0015768FC6|nr:peptidylprolyl isomerase [Rhodoferax sp. BAB1]QKO21718.1 peptidylprolyl isomerase [Rhodoferax sp. BAB1]